MAWLLADSRLEEFCRRSSMVPTVPMNSISVVASIIVQRLLTLRGEEIGEAG